MKEKVLKMNEISSPDHYGFPGGVEVIDLTRHMDFLLGNVVKYVCRAGRKEGVSGLEDLLKAERYLGWALLREMERSELEQGQERQ